MPFPVGERVVGSFQVACGECPACRKGQFFACSRGGVFGFGLALGNLPGAQAERVRVPFARHTLFPIGDLPAEEAILAGDILTTAYGGVRPFLTPGMSVAVVGSGPVGLMAQMVAHALGAGQVYAIDPEEARLEKAKALGSLPIHPKAEDPVARVRRETEGLGADLVVEAVGGDGEALKLALRLAGPGGVVSSLGVPTAERLDYPWLPAFSRGITLRSALANVPRWIGEVLALQKAGRLKGSFVFSHRLPWRRPPKATASSTSGRPPRSPSCPEASLSADSFILPRLAPLQRGMQKAAGLTGFSGGAVAFTGTITRNPALHWKQGREVRHGPVPGGGPPHGQEPGARRQAQGAFGPRPGGPLRPPGPGGPPPGWVYEENEVRRRAEEEAAAAKRALEAQGIPVEEAKAGDISPSSP